MPKDIALSMLRRWIGILSLHTLTFIKVMGRGIFTLFVHNILLQNSSGPSLWIPAWLFCSWCWSEVCTSHSGFCISFCELFCEWWTLAHSVLDSVDQLSFLILGVFFTALTLLTVWILQTANTPSSLFLFRITPDCWFCNGKSFLNAFDKCFLILFSKLLAFLPHL